METATYVTVAIFMAGVIYQAGRLSVRVEELEKWRASVDAAREEINEHFAELKELFVNARR
jgi:uncharacterized membrane-anchored protein YhcB (DUF1043 family)